MKTPTRIAVVILSLVGALADQRALASPLLLKFAGELELVYDEMGLDPSIVVGAPFFGSFSYDPAVDLDTDPDPGEGRYYPSGPMTGQVANFAFDTAMDFVIGVVNDSIQGYDVFAAMTYEFFDPDLLASYHLFLLDESGTALDSDALPVSIPLEGFTERSFYFRVIYGDDNPAVVFDAYGTVTSLTIVPEPGALVLLGAGLLLRRRSCR